MTERCKWCGSQFVYPLHNSEIKYSEEKETVIEYKVLGCNDCGKIMFIRIVVK